MKVPEGENARMRTVGREQKKWPLCRDSGQKNGRPFLEIDAEHAI